MKKRFSNLKAPNVVVVLFIMIVVATILTYIIPAGAYESVVDAASGRTVYDPTSFHYVEGTGTSLLGMFESIPNGIIDAISIGAIVLIYGAAFGIISKTKVIDCALASSIDKLRRYSFLIIPVIMILFSLLGAFLGISESCWAFLPMICALAETMGFDAIVGFAMVMLANNMGFTAGPMNYWTTGVAQGIAELPLYSGLGLRLGLYVLNMVLCIGYVLLYCRKIKKDPTRGLMYNANAETGEAGKAADLVPEFTTRKKIALTVMLIGFAGLIYGLIGLGWWSGSTIGGYLLIVAILTAVVDGQSANDIADGFVQGAHNVLLGALAVSMARSILLILQGGQVVDTILYGMYCALSALPKTLSAVCIYLFQFFFNFLVPSGSGQAAVTMPLITPLADMIGITRQTAVVAFQLGDGFTNMLWPTAVLGALSITKVDYKTWLKWFMPFVLLFTAVCIVVVIICTAAAVGPF